MPEHPLLQTLQIYLRYGDLLIVWADSPWAPLASLPLARAAVIARMRGEARGLPPAAWPLPDLPQAPILSLDPTGRLARLFAAAGKPLRRVRTLADVPAAGQHNLLQLGGDLDARQGLLLTWEDVAGLRVRPDPRHLLDEAARACRFGAVLVLKPGADLTFASLWPQVLAPALGDAPAFGLGPGPWPDGMQPLPLPPEYVFAALAQVQIRAPAASNARIEALKAERAGHLRRLQELQGLVLLHPAGAGLRLQIEEAQRSVAAVEQQLDALIGGD